MITLKIIPILPLSPGGLRPGRASGSERRGRGEGEHAMSTPISIVRLSSRWSPPPSETVLQWGKCHVCHSEPFGMCHPDPEWSEGEGSRFLAQGKLREACTERSEVTQQILHFVQDDTSCQILRLTPQNDIVTQSPGGRGWGWGGACHVHPHLKPPPSRERIRLGNFHVLWETNRPWPTIKKTFMTLTGRQQLWKLIYQFVGAALRACAL